MLDDVDLPELADRTDRFHRGAPHAITVGADGARVAFLRSAGEHDPAGALWALNVATATERLIADPAQLLVEGAPGRGIEAYAVDTAARVAAFAYAGRLFRADLHTGDVVEVAAHTPVIDPRPDPTGQRIAYVTMDGGAAALRVVGPDGDDELLAGERGGLVSWGVPEAVAAHEFGRARGWWWAPDGRSVLAARSDSSRVPLWQPDDASAPVNLPRAGGRNVQVSLHLLDLDGGWVDVHWDRETYPYLVDVRWAEGGGPLITVLRRLQQHGLVLSVDPRTGETQVHAELADARWVEPVPGTPRHLPDGRVLVGGELAHDGFDARCLFADGSLLTPPTLYVRRVVGVLPRPGLPAAGPDLVLEGNDGDPGEQHIFRVRTALGGGGAEARRLSSTPGWHSAEVGGDVLVVGTRSLEHDGVRWTVWRGEAQVCALASTAAATPYQPRPSLERVTDRRLPAAVLYPAAHLIGRRLPVLLELGDGPGHQTITAARADWQERQWWAEAGFAVVSVDTRGTPGIAPSFEKVVHRRLADVALTDQVDALIALTGKHPDLDLTRVAVRGTGLGGWLAALAVLRRPDLFACAVARTPATDWTLLRTALAERYLGLPEEVANGGEVYAHHSLVEIAAELPAGPDDARPMLLVQALADESVLPAHTLRLSTALLSAGRPHAVLPLSGVRDVASGVAAQLLPQELDFIRRHLP
jgi:dipeptidyl-peptidase-4